MYVLYQQATNEYINYVTLILCSKYNYVFTYTNIKYFVTMLILNYDNN